MISRSWQIFRENVINQFLTQKMSLQKQQPEVEKLLPISFRWSTTTFRIRLLPREMLVLCFWLSVQLENCVFKVTRRSWGASKGHLLLYQGVWSEANKLTMRKAGLGKELAFFFQLQGDWFTTWKILSLLGWKILKLSSSRKLIEHLTWVSRKMLTKLSKYWNRR